MTEELDREDCDHAQVYNNWPGDWSPAESLCALCYFSVRWRSGWYA